MNTIDNLQWRYATKNFDSAKKLSSDQLQLLLESINLTPSSYGLQPYKVILIQDPNLRQQLRAVSNNQPQVTEASDIILFAAQTNINATDVDAYLQRIVDTRKVSLSSLSDYENMMKSSISNLSNEETTQWAAKQCYIALGQLMSTCANEKIDACPMEGFNKSEFDKILNLDTYNLTSVVMAPVGFRSENDKYQHLTKVRRDLKDLVIKI